MNRIYEIVKVKITQKSILALSVLFVLVMILGTAYSQSDVSSSFRQSTGRIMVDDEIIDTFIETRTPEVGVLPRRETEEISFSLNFIRRQLINSNRLLY